MTTKLSEVPLEKPISIICHRDDVVIENDLSDVVSIDPGMTIKCASEIDDDTWTQLKLHPEFMRLFRLVFPTIELPDHSLQLHGSGVRHVVGLLVLTFNAMHDGKRPLWRFPESYLHPSAQLGLADVLVALTKGVRL